MKPKKYKRYTDDPKSWRFKPPQVPLGCVVEDCYLTWEVCPICGNLGHGTWHKTLGNTRPFKARRVTAHCHAVYDFDKGRNLNCYHRDKVGRIKEREVDEDDLNVSYWINPRKIPGWLAAELSGP